MKIFGVRLKILVLWLARAAGLFLLMRRITASRIRILCYHGGCLGDENEFNSKLFCSTNTFRKRLDWLQKKGFNFARLDDAVDTPPALRRRLETVITFDDGWHSTASKLLPMLAEHRIPSTLYLCTQHFLEAWPVLNVTVRYILWKSPLKTLHIESVADGVDGEHHMSSVQARELLARHIVSEVTPKLNNREEVCRLLEQLAACAGLDIASLNLASGRFDYMSASELRAAAASGCTIELHGHQHRYPQGEPGLFYADLARCEEVILAAGLPKPRHYCYPSGNFDEGAMAVLKDRKVVSATTCIPGLVDSASAPICYYLPRFLDGDSIHPLEFEAELSGFSHLLRRVLRKQASGSY